MAEMEVNPQEEMANPKGMKVFAVKRPWLPEDFVSFPACAEMADCLGSATVVARGETLCFRLTFS